MALIQSYKQRLKTFYDDIVMDVVHTYFELKVLGNMTFEKLLEENLHILFHMWKPKTKCCECLNNPLTESKRRQELNKNQFELLYISKDQSASDKEHIHAEKCLRIFTPNTMTLSAGVISLDICLVYILVKHCMTPGSFPGNPSVMEDIKNCRNFHAHIGTNDNDIRQQLENTWSTLESSVQYLADILGRAYKHGLQKRIDALKSSHDLDYSLEKRFVQLFIDHTEPVGKINFRFERTEFKTNTTKLDSDYQTEDYKSSKNKLRLLETISNFRSAGCKRYKVYWKFENLADDSEVKLIEEKLSCLARISDFVVECVYEGSIVVVTTINLTTIETTSSLQSITGDFLKQLVGVAELDSTREKVVRVEVEIVGEAVDSPVSEKGLGSPIEIRDEENIKKQSFQFKKREIRKRLSIPEKEEFPTKRRTVPATAPSDQEQAIARIKPIVASRSDTTGLSIFEDPRTHSQQLPPPVVSYSSVYSQSTLTRRVQDVPSSMVCQARFEYQDISAEKEEDVRNRNVIAAMGKRHLQFYESKMFYNAFQSLNFSRFLAIIGASGDGKTSLAEHLAMHLKRMDKDYQLEIIHDPETFAKKLKVAKKQVFIVDDPFGKQNLNEEVLTAWVKLSRQLKDSISKDHTLVLSTVRKPLYQANQRRINETMLTEAVFDLSQPENQLSGDEKIGMLRKCLTVDELPVKLLKEIQEQGYFPGYPLWCHFVKSEIGKRKYSSLYIRRPEIAIRQIVEEIKDTNLNHYCSLVLAVLSKNAIFDVNDLIVCERDYGKDGNPLQTKIFNIMKSCNVDYKRNDCSIEMKKAFEHLEGVFFIKDHSEYRVLHDLITGTVAEMYGGSNLHNILEYSDSGFLREYVRTKHAADVEDLGVCIKMTRESYCGLLAQRFKQDIEKGNQVDVFLNPSISDIHFRPHFIDVLMTLSFSELKSLMYIQPPMANSELSIIVKYTKFALDIAILSSTPFHWLCRLGLVDVFNSVISRVGDKKVFVEQLPGSTTPLHFAAGYGHLEIVKKLVEIGVDINVKSSLKVMNSDKIGEFYSGFTPLLYAARQNHPKVAEFLLQNKADPNIVRDHGGSPMLLAADRGHTEVVRILLQYGGDPDIFCDHGTTPLILAAQDGHLDTVKVLIKHGAKLDRQKYETNISALFAAAKKGHIQCVKYLVEKGANINLKGENNLTPLAVAMQNNHKEIADYLTERQRQTE